MPELPFTTLDLSDAMVDLISDVRVAIAHTCELTEEVLGDLLDAVIPVLATLVLDNPNTNAMIRDQIWRGPLRTKNVIKNIVAFRDRLVGARQDLTRKVLSLDKTKLYALVDRRSITDQHQLP